MINSTPQSLLPVNEQSDSFRSICTMHKRAWLATIMLMLWPAFAAAENGRHLQLLQTVAFAPQPIESWSRLYHCVLTAAEFRKALRKHTVDDRIRFSSTAGEETGSATASVTPAQPIAPMTPLAPPPGIPILAQMLPQIADVTMVAPAGNDANSPSAIASVQSASETLAHLSAKEGQSNRAAGSRQPGAATPTLESEVSASDGPTASYPVSKAKFADIKARETKLGLPASGRKTAAAAVMDGSARAPKHPDLGLFQASTFDSLPPESFVGKSSKNGFVEKQTGY
jgi:hypothetical protein